MAQNCLRRVAFAPLIPGRGRKAQLAMEFLLSYGWMMTILAVIFASFVFFLENKTDTLSERCVFPSPFSCLDHKILSGGVEIKLLNVGTRAVIVNNISIESTPENCSMAFDQYVEKDSEHLFGVPCSINGYDGRFKTFPVITYKNVDTGMTKALRGELSGKISN
jgi:hypothetical protein